MKQPLHDQKLARVQAFVSSQGAPQGTAVTMRMRDRYGRAHTPPRRHNGPYSCRTTAGTDQGEGRMNRSTIAALTATATLTMTGSAAAATPAQLRASAGALIARKCAQIAGKGCHNIQARDAGRSYYNPAGGFGPGSMKFAYRFGGWANYTTPAAGWYNCTVYVKNSTSASGTVQC